MTNMNAVTVCGIVVEEEIQFSLVELSRACGTDVAQLILLVEEGVLTPSGDYPQEWLFAGATLKRARSAARVTQGLELSAAGTALVLELLDEIDALRTKLHRMGVCS